MWRWTWIGIFDPVGMLLLAATLSAPASAAGLPMMLTTMLLAGARPSVRVVTYGNTALAGAPTANRTAPGVGSLELPPYSSAVLSGQLAGAGQWALFSLEGPTGYARLWIDDHLLIDAALGPLHCHPGGQRDARAPGYRLWGGANMPTIGADDPHSMRADGGDCTQGCTAARCTALCSGLRLR